VNTGAIDEAVRRSVGTVDSRSEEEARDAYGRLVDGGWSQVGVPESFGGGGGTIADAAEVTAAVARSGIGMPIAESTMIMGWFAEVAGLALPSTARCVIPVVPSSVFSRASDGLLTGRAPRVAWASWATHLMVPLPAGNQRLMIACVEASQVRLCAGTNLAGEPREDVWIDSVQPSTVKVLDIEYANFVDELLAVAALARCVQMAAVIPELLTMSARYGAEREQFGRPIAAFQAVQQMLSTLAAESAAAAASVDLAIAAWRGGPQMTAVAVAKARCSSAAGVAARVAHQIHGAIGLTEEHHLQRYTRALWAWREEYGAEQFWARRLAEAFRQESGTPWERILALTDRRARLVAPRGSDV